MEFGHIAQATDLSMVIPKISTYIFGMYINCMYIYKHKESNHCVMITSDNEIYTC